MWKPQFLLIAAAFCECAKECDESPRVVSSRCDISLLEKEDFLGTGVRDQKKSDDPRVDKSATCKSYICCMYVKNKIVVDNRQDVDRCTILIAGTTSRVL